MIVASNILKQILKDIDKVARSDASVFIYGESGTGKEVVAHAIHRASLRVSSPFIKVNCAAIPETLMESEFFGHEKGAFTGALARRIGRFELADKGTLLLDEITEIPLSIQAKLLRAIQEREFERLGGQESIQVDVRLIATSNRDMQTAIGQKIFREDLFYRLNVIPIHLPPLRERTEDILPLAEYFLEKACNSNRIEKKTLSSQAQEKLLRHFWPGNVRELANVMERVAVLHTGSWIEPEHLFLETALACQLPAPVEPQSFQPLPLAEIEKKHILKMLAYHKNNRMQTANALDISIRTLRNKLKEYAYTQTENPEAGEQDGGNDRIPVQDDRQLLLFERLEHF